MSQGKNGEDGLNYYNYCGNNPVNNVDSDGHRLSEDWEADERRKDKMSPEEEKDRDYEPRDPGKDLRGLKEAEKGIDQDQMGLTPTGGQIDKYSYNSAGLRFKKKEDVSGSNIVIYSMYSGNNPVIEEKYDDASLVETRFSEILDQRKVILSGQQIYLLYIDSGIAKGIIVLVLTSRKG